MKSELRSRASTYQVVYTNNVTLMHTIYDLSLYCGQSEMGENGTTTEDHVKVVMSLEHAKVLSRMLAETLKRIERELRPIADIEIMLPPAGKERGQ